MSQSRFSIVLVGVSALLRRPLVSRLRPAGFTARCSGGFCRSVSPSVSEIAAGRVGLRAHASVFRHAPLQGCRWAGWPSGSRLPLFGTHRFGIATRRVGLRAHGFRFSARTASGLPSAGWPSGSRLPLFGMRRSAPPHRRREGRRSTPTRHLFHFKTLIPTC